MQDLFHIIRNEVGFVVTKPHASLLRSVISHENVRPVAHLSLVLTMTIIRQHSSFSVPYSYVFHLKYILQLN